MVTIVGRRYHIMCGDGFIDWSRSYETAIGILEIRRLDTMNPECGPHTLTAKEWTGEE